MADEKRYTPQHLYDDIFGDEGAGWTRQRVRHLASNGLVEQVGSSRMYIITTWGMAALDLRDTYDDEENPQDFIQRVIHHAESASESGESPNSTA